MTNTPVYLGVDVSKDSLDLHWLGKSLSVPNSGAGFRTILKLIAKRPEATDAHVICEATGGYERAMTKVLHHQQITLSVVNPRLPRDFARSHNRLAKTDAIDAKILADFGAANRPLPTAQPDPNVELLAEYVSRRDSLVAERAEHKCRLRQAHTELLKKQSQRFIDFISKEIKAIEKEMLKLVAADHALAKRTARLDALPGIDWRSALTLCAHMPELGSLNRQEAAALAGVAPFNRDSGKWRGQRHISAGRAPVRRTLYLASLTAVRKNTTLKTFYQRLRANGKKAKVALIAVARKIIILLNAALKENSTISLA